MKTIHSFIICLYLLLTACSYFDKYEPVSIKSYNFNSTIHKKGHLEASLNEAFLSNGLSIERYGPGVDYSDGDLGVITYHISDKDSQIIITLLEKPPASLRIHVFKAKNNIDLEKLNLKLLSLKNVANQLDATEYFTLILDK